MNTPTQSNMIAAGVYHAKPLKETWVELAKAREGAPDDRAGQCSIALAITQDGPYKGREYVWYGSFHEKAHEITMRTLGELGITFDAEGVPNLANLADDVRIGIVLRQQREYDDATGQLVDVFEDADKKVPKLIPQINYITRGPAMAKAETDANKIAAHRARMRGAANAAGLTTPNKTEEGLPKGPDGKPVF